MARALLATILVTAAPAAAWACPVCGLASAEDNAWAYGAMSVLLSAVPLGFVAGIVIWIRRASRHRDSP